MKRNEKVFAFYTFSLRYLASFKFPHYLAAHIFILNLQLLYLSLGCLSLSLQAIEKVGEFLWLISINRTRQSIFCLRIGNKVIFEIL